MTATARNLGHGWAALMAGVVIASAATASDYSNSCTSSDGRFVMDDGALYRATDKAQANKLAYAIVERQVLTARSGYCIAAGPGATGQKIGFQSNKTRLEIEIDEAGSGRPATMTCEMASDGMPAAYRCAREVIERDQKSPSPIENYELGTPGAWQHNGSVMRLEASGAERRFIYMNPRKGLRDAGISGDVILFDGRREGNRYVGTARYFSKACGEQTFAAAGTVSADERRVELAGNAPRIDGRCRTTGTIAERLVFTRNP